MPRRPKSSSGKNKRPRPLKRSDASIERWKTLEDIPLDEEDQFHTSRDRILLEGEIDEDLEDDDEVFALKGLDEDDSEEELQAAEDDEHDLQDAESSEPKRSKSKKKATKKRKKIATSEEEDEEEEEEETWGHKASAYYSSNAAQIESDDEEALKMEEEEAMRLQEKARDGMDENDFGLNDPHDEQQAMEVDDLADPAPAVLPALPNDKKALLRHLEKNSPEALALARDWDDSVQSLSKVRATLEELQSTNPESLSLDMTHLYYQTLITYTTTLAFYLYLRANEKYAQRPESLRTHPIMTRLLTLKQSLATLEELDFAPEDSDDEFDEDEDEEDSGLDLNELEIIQKFAGQFGRLELLNDALVYQEGSIFEARQQEQQDTQQKPPKKKRKTSKDSSAPVQPIFDLVEPVFKPTKKASTAGTSTQDSVSDVYGEALSLHHADVADKSARRKSLRFHTTKIESAGARRQGARQALGGDDDIPYRERRKEKEARLLKETKERVKSQGGADLDDTEPEPRRNDKEDADADGYYNLVKKQSKEKKEKKKADYEAKRAALRQDLVEETTDGPRSLTKAILTNRGLTPHRSKSSRNPRVRKREKYEKAKKKVASQKAVYKGGLSESGGHYDGEKSGISKVVKGVRLA